jgi:hypothetical protein
MFSTLGALGHGVVVVAGAIAQSVKNLGSGFVIGCVAAVGLGYAICLGVGTVGMRMVVTRKAN